MTEPLHAGNALDQAYTVLVVDDEADLRQVYQTALERIGYRVVGADTVAGAKHALQTNPHIDCVVSDYRLPDGTGLELMAYVAQHYAGLPLSMMTAYGNPDHAVQALKAGVFDYLSKPVAMLDLRKVVAQMLAQNELRQRNAPAAVLSQIATLLPGVSPAMRTLHQHMAQLVQTQTCLAFQGESGTGKELAARAVHACGLRAAQPFVVFNCAAVSGDDAVRGLFGEHSSSTRATFDGAFQQAQGGTLLLDDVAALSLSVQFELLNALQERSIRRFRSAKSEATDVRVMVSSVQALDQLFAQGRLRQDLFYRLNVMVLDVPPLRDRIGDAAWLAHRWLARHPQGKSMQLSDRAVSSLNQHAFLGNVRELENALERSVALAAAQQLDVVDVVFQEPKPKAATTVRSSNVQRIDAQLSPAALAPHIAHTVHTSQVLPPPRSAISVTTSSVAALGAAPPHQNLAFPMDLTAHLAAVERGVIEQALQLCRYNRSQTASNLGLSLRQLRYRIEQLGIAD